MTSVYMLCDGMPDSWVWEAHIVAYRSIQNSFIVFCIWFVVGTIWVLYTQVVWRALLQTLWLTSSHCGSILQNRNQVGSLVKGILFLVLSNGFWILFGKIKIRLGDFGFK